MKNRNAIIILIIVVLIALIYAIISQYKNKYNWDKTYDLKGDQPYDFEIFYSLITKQSLEKVKSIDVDFKEVISKAIKDSSDKVYTYICISEYPVLTKSEIDLLYEFVEKGNQALLISESIADKFMLEITGNESNSSTLTSMVRDTVSYVFDHPSLSSENPYTYSYYYKDKTYSDYKVFFVNDFYFSKPNFVPLVKEQKNPNNLVYFYHTIKKGKVFFHTDLMPFTNYYMIKENGYEYVNKVINHLKPSQIIWDLAYPRKDSEDDGASYISKSKSPIDFILERKELAVAWYLLLSVALLFLVFGIRRLQNPIPVINYRKNTSLNFVETISSIYKHKSAYKEIAHLKMEHFLWFLRNKIGVSTSRLNNETSKEISRKTGIEEKVVTLIFEHYENRIQGNSNVTQEDIILFNSKITNFHNKLKDEQRRKQQLRKSK